MTFTILTTLEVASLLVFAVSLYGSVRAVYERDKLRKQTPLALLSRYRVLYRRVAAVWGRYAVGALVLANAWWVPLYMGFGGEETTAWMSAYVSVNLGVPIASDCNGHCCPLLLRAQPQIWRLWRRVPLSVDGARGKRKQRSPPD